MRIAKRRCPSFPKFTQDLINIIIQEEHLAETGDSTGGQEGRDDIEKVGGMGHLR